MAAAGAILARCLQMLRAKARPGVTTAELDEAAERFIRSQGAEPAFKGYRGFPGSICASPNSMVVHGIPGTYKLQRGDILSIDVGVVLDGWVSDAAVTVPIGPVTPIATRLLQTTRESLFEAVEQVRARQPPGRRLARGPAAGRGRRLLGRPRRSSGHGVGREMHEDPQIPNYGEPGTGPELEEGMVLAIEPMVNGGRGRHPDGLRQLVGLLPGRVAGVPTSSTRSRSPQKGPGSSPPGTWRRPGGRPDAAATFICPRR